ncbi:ABC transporter permease [Streptomyces sp. SDT5-1]|uniref:ABC transporter permease n=1 Tax=Streptomyces sp. SDT5-1 TaxID=3406418 RepID=UPI003FD3FE60
MTTQTAAADPAAGGDAVPFLQRIGQWQRRVPLFQLLALAALYGYGLSTIDSFGSQRVLYAILINASLLGLAGAGQTIVVLVGGIDFSIAAFISAGDVIIAQLCGTYHWSLGPAALVALAVGLAGGVVNGVVSYRFKVEPLIVTLGVSALLSGLILKWINGASTGVTPAWLGRLTAANGTTFSVGIPPVVPVWAVVAVVIGVVLSRTRAGRSLYLTGVNQPAALLALVRVGRTWIFAYVASAVLATFVGILLAGYSGSGNVAIGDPYLFQSLAAVIVGGTMFGGRGDYWRTMIGALVLSVIALLLSAHQLSSAQQDMITGGLILLVVGLYGRERRLRDRI